MPSPSPVTDEFVNADDRVLTPREVAGLIGLSLFTMLRMRQANAGPPWVQISPNRIGYRLGDVKAYLAAQRVGALPNDPDITPEVAALHQPAFGSHLRGKSRKAAAADDPEAA
jgi:predicted DNA-binding transcriptional regulator AlpA